MIQTPIFFAKNKEALYLLLQAKADINLQLSPRYESFTPIHEAVYSNKTVIFKELLKCKADTTIKDRNGRTPFDLMKASFCQTEEFNKIIDEVGHEKAVVTYLSEDNNFVPAAIARLIHEYAFSYIKKEVAPPFVVAPIQNNRCVVQ